MKRFEIIVDTATSLIRPGQYRNYYMQCNLNQPSFIVCRGIWIQALYIKYFVWDSETLAAFLRLCKCHTSSWATTTYHNATRNVWIKHSNPWIHHITLQQNKVFIQKNLKYRKTQSVKWVILTHAWVGEVDYISRCNFSKLITSPKEFHSSSMNCSPVCLIWFKCLCWLQNTFQLQNCCFEQLIA